MLDRQDRHALAERYRRQLPPGFSRRLEEVRTPPGLKELVTEFATEDISEERVLLFLRRRMCQSLEVHTMIEERNSSCVFAILAADLILSGENTKAVYMMFYYALVNEVRSLCVQLILAQTLPSDLTLLFELSWFCASLHA